MPGSPPGIEFFKPKFEDHNNNHSLNFDPNPHKQNLGIIGGIKRMQDSADFIDEDLDKALDRQSKLLKVLPEDLNQIAVNYDKDSPEESVDLLKIARERYSDEINRAN